MRRFIASTVETLVGLARLSRVETGARLVKSFRGDWRLIGQRVEYHGYERAIIFRPLSPAALVFGDRIYDAHFHEGNLRLSPVDEETMQSAGLGGLIVFNAHGEYRIYDNPNFDPAKQDARMLVRYASCNIQRALQTGLSAVLPGIEDYWDRIQTQLQSHIDQITELITAFSGETTDKAGKPQHAHSVANVISQWLTTRGENLGNFCLDGHQISHAIEDFMFDQGLNAANASPALAKHIFKTVYQKSYDEAAAEDAGFAQDLLKAVEDAINNDEFSGGNPRQSFMKKFQTQLAGLKTDAEKALQAEGWDPAHYAGHGHDHSHGHDHGHDHGHTHPHPARAVKVGTAILDMLKRGGKKPRSEGGN